MHAQRHRRLRDRAGAILGAAFLICSVLAVVPAGAAPARPAAEVPTAGPPKQVERTAPELVVDQSAQEALWKDIQHHVNDNQLKGLAGGSYEPDERTVEIFWAGKRPAAFRDIARRHQATATLKITTAPHGKERIGALSKRLIAQAEQRDIPIRSVGSTADFAGLRAEVDPSATPGQRAALRALGAAEISEGAGKPVFLARYADTPAFWGGAAIDNGQWTCSTGWAVRELLGATSMVTAKHCGPNLPYWTYANVLPVGQAGFGHEPTDSMLITGERYSGFTYVGPWDSSTGTPINEALDPALNTIICAGGALSGEVCGATVREVNVTGPTGHGPGFYAVLLRNNEGLAGQGDSGGPAYTRTATGRIILRGMIQSAFFLEQGRCNGGTSNPWNADRFCFFRVFFTNQSAVHAGNGSIPVLVP